jgi:hypothetical protein
MRTLCCEVCTWDHASSCPLCDLVDKMQTFSGVRVDRGDEGAAEKIQIVYVQTNPSTPKGLEDVALKSPCYEAQTDLYAAF